MLRTESRTLNEKDWGDVDVPDDVCRPCIALILDVSIVATRA